MVKKILKKQKGFTLIELLAVIVILGIIAAIAVPAIGNIINKSEQKAALSDAQQIIDAAKIAISADNIKFDTTNGATTATWDDTNKVLVFTGTSLAPYLDTPSTFTLNATKSDTGNIEYYFTAHEAIDITDAEKAVVDDTKLTEEEIQTTIASN